MVRESLAKCLDHIRIQQVQSRNKPSVPFQVAAVEKSKFPTGMSTQENLSGESQRRDKGVTCGYSTAHRSTLLARLRPSQTVLCAISLALPGAAPQPGPTLALHSVEREDSPNTTSLFSLTLKSLGTPPQSRNSPSRNVVKGKANPPQPDHLDFPDCNVSLLEELLSACNFL